MITRPGYVIEKTNWKMEVLYGNIWEYHGNIWGYPLVIGYIAIEHGLFEIVDLAVKHGGSFRSCFYVYQG